MSQVQIKDCLNGIIGQSNNETSADWSNYIREILKDCLNDAQPIGGRGAVVLLLNSVTRSIPRYNMHRYLS